MREALFAFSASDASCGNPASLHAFGRGAAALVAEAERAVLKTLGAPPDDWAVTFTGSGTEANQLAIRAALGGAARRGARAVWSVSEVEHASVLELVPEMERGGTEIRRLKPDAKGELSGVAEAADGASLLSVIGVGNETGILHQNSTSHILSANPTPRARRTIWHVDFVAGWGKARLDLGLPGSPDLVAIAGHKLGGIAGVGALAHRRAIAVARPGTPNLAGIVALKALADRWGDVVGEIDRLGTLRDEFERTLVARFPSVRITGGELPRVPNVSHFTFPGLKKDLSLVQALDLRGFAVSAGSACASRAPEPSHVLRAMGMTELDARNAVRVSLHPGNTAADLAAFVDAVDAILRRNEVL